MMSSSSSVTFQDFPLQRCGGRADRHIHELSIWWYRQFQERRKKATGSTARRECRCSHWQYSGECQNRWKHEPLAKWNPGPSSPESSPGIVGRHYPPNWNPGPSSLESNPGIAGRHHPPNSNPSESISPASSTGISGRHHPPNWNPSPSSPESSPGIAGRHNPPNTFVPGPLNQIRISVVNKSDILAGNNVVLHKTSGVLTPDCISHSVL
jgi:hypothetical protein